MALDFPASPTVGQLYPAVPTPGQPQYKWDGNAWVNVVMPYPDAPADGKVYGRLNNAWAQVMSVAADQAAAADYRANSNGNKYLSPSAVWNAVQQVAVTDAPTVTLDFNTAFDFVLVLGGNRTLANPTNVKMGQKGILYLAQDSTGGRSVTWGTNWKFPGGVKPTLSAASGALDMISYVGGSAGLVYCTYSLGFA